MLKDYIHYIFSYTKIRNLLLSYNYTPEECRSTLRRLRQMDGKVLHAFLHWVATSEYPKEYLNDVSVKDLVELRKMKPPAAFLAADWMGQDATTAAYVLSRGSKDSEESEFPVDIPEDLQEKVAKLEVEDEPEDETAFESPTQL